MTIAVSNNRVQYAGNGVTTAFAFPFRFLANADLVVISTTGGVDTILVLNTGYTVTGAGNPAGGTVTCTAAPAVGTTLTIYSDPQLEQTVDLVDNGPFPAEVFEGSLDKLTLISRRLKDRIDRTLRQPDSDATALNPLPTQTIRANGGLGSIAGYDANGQPIIAAGGASVPVSLAMAAVVQAGTRTIARDLLGVPYKNAVVDFGAVGDDATNNDAAMSAAVAWLNANQGIVFWPVGKYRFNTAAPNITATGGGFIGERGWTNLGGTCFRFNSATGNLLTLAAASGVLISGIRFTPVPYRTSGAEIRIQGGCQSILIEKCNFAFTALPIDIGDATWTTIRDCVSLNNTSVAHVRTKGEGSGTQVCDGVVIDNIITGSGDNPSWNTVKGNWATATGYSLGDFVIANGSIWKCTQAGTSAGAGTGPNTATAGYVASSDPATVDVTDNTAKWRFQCSQNAAGVLIDSYSLYVKVLHSDLNSGAWGVLVTDSVASSSEPKHVSLIGTFIDHVYEDCVRLAAGQGVFILQPLFSAAAEGRGIYVPDSGTFKGDLTIIGGQNYSHAAEGIWIEKTTAQHIKIEGLVNGGNSLKTANTYDGIKFASGVTHFQVIGCQSRPLIDAFGTQRYGVDIGASCQHFVIFGNDVQGNGTGGINDAATTTANKRLGSNPGDALNQVAITVGASPFTWTNPTGKPVQVTIAGGTVSNIQVNGIQVAAATNEQVVLWVGGNVTVVYSVAPTMNYIPLA